MASTLQDFQLRLCRPHYIINFLMGPTYGLYLYFTAASRFNIEEELKLMIGILLLSLLKFRSSPTAEERIGNLSLNLKLVAIYMAYARQAWYSLVLFLIFWIITFMVFPLPGYRGYSRIEVITKLSDLDAAIASTVVSHRSNRPSTSTAPVVIVMFAATWAPASRYFETTYAKLSLKYQSERIRFLIFDIDADPMVGEKYKINTSSSSTELPTVVLYRDGQEKRRLPVRGEGAAARLAWTRTFDSVVNAFELDSLVGATQERGSDKRNA